MGQTNKFRVSQIKTVNCSRMWTQPHQSALLAVEFGFESVGQQDVMLIPTEEADLMYLVSQIL